MRAGCARWHGCRRALGGWLLAGLLSLSPVAADVVDEVSSLSGDEALSGAFRQVLVSRDDDRQWTYSGRYRYSPQHGLTWQVREPIRGSLRIDADGDTQASGELGGLKWLTRRTVGRLVVAMVSMDRAVLERYYEIAQHRDEDGFEIVLTAHPNWRRQAGNVTLRGERRVESVRIEFPDGRAMQLELTHDA